jgi:FtsH-binding integral membrane protein
VEKLRMPLLLTALYILLIGLCTLSPTLVRGVFGYEVKDAGVLLVLSAAFLGSGVVLWSIASDPGKYGTLAMAVFTYLIIFIVFLLWGWVSHLYTLRNVVIPLIINIVLAAWMWSSRTRSS